MKRSPALILLSRDLLHDHVRFEERRLFALLEERLGEDELLTLGRAVEAAHG